MTYLYLTDLALLLYLLKRYFPPLHRILVLNRVTVHLLVVMCLKSINPLYIHPPCLYLLHVVALLAPP
jgi:hypothetical protein